MKAVVKKTKNNQFRFNLIADNGKVVATSETYTTKAMASKTIRNHFPGHEIVDLTKPAKKK